MSDHAKTAILGEGGFRGHGCAFCADIIPLEEKAQLPIAILAGGRTFRLWAHRKCLVSRVSPKVAAQIETLPSPTREEVLAVRVTIA